MLCLALLAGGLIPACADSAASDDSVNEGGDWESVDSGLGTQTFTDGTQTIPDNEMQDRYSAPQPSGSYLYTANRATGNVAVIDSNSLAVEVVSVGAEPIAVHALAAGINQGAAAIVHRNAAIAVLRTGMLGATQVIGHAGVQGVNALASSPDGRYVVAYHDVDSTEGGVGGSDQEIVMIDTSSVAPAITLTVGLHPRDVVFTPDSALAYVLTADGVSRIDLQTLSSNSATTLLRVVPSHLDPSLAETQILAAYRQAVTRVRDRSEIYVTNLDSGAMQTLAIEGTPDDLDVGESVGKVWLTFAGVPNSQFLEYTLPLSDASQPATTVLAQRYLTSAQISADGRSALLYALAEPEKISDDAPDTSFRKQVTVLGRNQAAQWADLQVLFSDAPVESVGIAPSGESAVLLHGYAPDLNSKAPWQYTLLDLRQSPLLRKVQSSSQPVRDVVFAPNSDLAGITLSAPNALAHEFALINLRSLVVRSYPMSLAPEQLGFIAQSMRFFVGQSHPVGRISLIGGDGTLQTITGFELGSTPTAPRRDEQAPR